MTKIAKEFNLKYNLNITEKSFKQVDIEYFINSDVSGKIKKNWKEILKRFFRIPWAVSSLIIFLIILFLSIILPHTTAFSPNNNISFHNGATLAVIKNQQPSFVIVNEWKDQHDINLINSYHVHYKILKLYNGKYFISWHPFDLISKMNKTPHYTSIMGTDDLGRDIWTRLWAGTFHSLWFALFVVIVTTVFGTIFGSWIGFYPGTILDILVMKIIALYNSVPSIVWYVVILFLLPKGVIALFILFIITGWMSSFGTSRIFMWKYVNLDFMRAADTFGISKIGKIFKHGLPNYLGIIAIGFVSAIPAIVESEASLAFIGLSPSPSDASLGNVLNEALKAIASGGSRVYYLIIPTIIIFIITMSLKYVALGLNDAIDPKIKKEII